MATGQINTINDHFVSTNGETFTMMRPLVEATPEEALRAAAWIVTMADPFSSVKFADIFAAVCNS